MKKIVFTCGDINGIGPEIVIKSIEKLSGKNIKLIYCCPKNVFFDSLKNINSELDFDLVNDISEINNSIKNICIINLGESEIKLGTPTRTSGLVSYKSIITALDIIDQNYADAVVTAPISKTALKLADIEFPGHTELLGDRYKRKDFKMMFLSDQMKCCLVTIHEKLSDVPNILNKKLLSETIEKTISTLRNEFDIQNPEIAVLALNPHAGENGKIGNEEVEIIQPVIENYKQYCSGPFVPDAFFGMGLHTKYDMIIGMYHDQVLIPFKLLNFDKGVNYTAGLPVVRTSPDHGTAYDIAGKGIAKPDSIIEAVRWAEIIINSRDKLNE